MSLLTHTEDEFSDKQDSLLAEYKKLAKNKPVLCSKVQPWKDPTVTHEMILDDLKGCIIRHYLAYNFGTAGYTAQDAVSDAYYAIMKAIDKDKLAPTVADKTIRCTKCDHGIQMPSSFAGDERANRICMESPRPMRYRRFWIDCPKCGHGFWFKKYKVMFSSLVYPFIRSAIQRSAQKWRRTNVVPVHNYAKDTPTIENKGHVLSIDGAHTTTDGEYAIKDSLAAPEVESRDEMPSSIIALLREVISQMPPNHQTAIAFNKGIGGLVEGVVPVTVRCRHCKDKKKKPTQFDATIDYSLSNNTAICPDCGCENEIDMCLSQTAIAAYLNMTKQRVCNILHTVERKLYESLKHRVNPDLL